MDTKRKETDELRTKVDDLYTKFLIQEETKLTITKQLNYWRCKALSLEVIISIFDNFNFIYLIIVSISKRMVVYNIFFYILKGSNMRCTSRIKNGLYESCRGQNLERIH